MDWEYFLNSLLGGLTRGSIYALIALGYTMVYGIIELINFAHGEIYMIGAFTALIVASVLTYLGWNQFAIIVLASVVAVIYSSAYGFTIEKIAYKPLRTAPRLSALISAIGMSLFLQNYVLLAQTSDFLPFPSLIPEFAFWEPYEHIISSPEIVILITTAVVMILLTFLIKFTRIGKAMRATSQDKIMAMLVGVDVNRVISVTFIVGSATAALGGVLIASHIGQINFYIGFIAGIKAFVAAVLGGIGSIPGAVLGSFVLGWTESFATGYISSDYEDVFAFLFLVFILIFRPAGILGGPKPKRSKPAQQRRLGQGTIDSAYDQPQRNKKILPGVALVHVSDLSDHGHPGQHDRKSRRVALAQHGPGGHRQFLPLLCLALFHPAQGAGQKAGRKRPRRQLPLAQRLIQNRRFSVPALAAHLHRHGRLSVRFLDVPDQHHDHRPDLRHAGPGAQHRGRAGRASGPGLCGLLRRGCLQLRPAQLPLRPQLLARPAGRRRAGGPFRHPSGLPGAAPAGGLPGHRDPGLRRDHPPVLENWNDFSFGPSGIANIPAAGIFRHRVVPWTRPPSTSIF